MTPRPWRPKVPHVQINNGDTIRCPGCGAEQGTACDSSMTMRHTDCGTTYRVTAAGPPTDKGGAA